MLRLHKRGPPLIARADARIYRDFVTYCFAAWRPSLRDTLKGLFSPRQLRYIQHTLALDLDVTPTAVPFEQWLALFRGFQSVGTVEAKRAIAGVAERLQRRQATLPKAHRTRVR